MIYELETIQDTRQPPHRSNWPSTRAPGPGRTGIGTLQITNYYNQWDSAAIDGLVGGIISNLLIGLFTGISPLIPCARVSSAV